MKRLIINADDFGLTAGVNRAVIDLNLSGKLPSTTLMAVAACTPQAASLARATPSLGVGCHVVLVDGVPILPAAQLPTLVDQNTGRFRKTLGGFVRDLFLGRIERREVQAEAQAQMAYLQSLGIELTHVDSHKHTHIYPGVLDPVLAAAKERKVSRIRNPFEPAWSITATTGAPAFRKIQVKLLNRFRPHFARSVASSGLISTDGAIGVLATGTLDAKTISSLMQAIPDGTWEMVTHPAYNDPDLANAGTRLIASRQVELSALETDSIPSDIKLIHFGKLA